MLVSPLERVGVFIDGPHLNKTCCALGIDVDFKRLLQLFGNAGRLVRASYYACVADNDDLNSVRPLLDWLEYNGYAVHTKTAKTCVEEGQRHGIDVDLAVDVMRLSASIDHVVLLSGNGDFARLVRVLKDLGKRSTVVSTLMTQPAMIADSLRRTADQFIDLADLKHEICRAARKPQVRGR
jgi:uncharacterized LabA/DUF88 family protein